MQAHRTEFVPIMRARVPVCPPVDFRMARLLPWTACDRAVGTAFSGTLYKMHVYTHADIITKCSKLKDIGGGI